MGQADAAAWYLEARYKLTASLFATLRWNPQVFGDVSDGLGGAEIGRQRGRLQQGEQLVAMQLTLKF